MRVRNAHLLGSELKVVGAEDLIGMKLFAGGVQDLEDVKGILQVSHEQLNFESLRGICDHYGHDVVQKLETILKEDQQ
jgi:hypothetical protein